MLLTKSEELILRNQRAMMKILLVIFEETLQSPINNEHFKALTLLKIQFNTTDRLLIQIQNGRNSG